MRWRRRAGCPRYGERFRRERRPRYFGGSAAWGLVAISSARKRQAADEEVAGTHGGIEDFEGEDVVVESVRRSWASFLSKISRVVLCLVLASAAVAAISALSFWSMSRQRGPRVFSTM